MGLAGFLTGLTVLACAGCQTGADDVAISVEETSMNDSVPVPEREDWNVCYMGGSKVGYERTTVRPMVREGRQVVAIEGLVHLAVKRFNDATEMEIRFTSTETPDGRLLDFESRVSAGVAPLVTQGTVEGNQLRMRTTSQGKSTASAIPWSDEYGGFLAVEQSLQRKPMNPGDRRTFRALVPGSNQVAEIDLEARNHEAVKLLGGTYDLLRIESIVALPGGHAMHETLWADRTGEVLRRKADTMNLESYRATRAVALETRDENAFDLGEGLSVKLDRPLNQPHQTKRVRYRIRLEGGDPAAAFVAGGSQRVESLDPHTADVTVFALRPSSETNATGPADPAKSEYLRANNFVQSDDPAIVTMAEETAGQIEDPWQAALELEQRVHQVITKRDYTQAFATAAEVVQSGAGDCTEHAVLLAALTRARGIPSRVAIGLVYMPDHQAFGYHMWNEVFIQERWIPVDATLARGGIGAAHLKLAHHSLDGAAAYTSFLPVAQVAGRLKIDVLEAE